MPSHKDIPRLIANRKLFDQTLYTSIEDAWVELERRRQDPALNEAIRLYLNGDIPEALSREPRAILFRHVLTPNFETRRFISLLDGFGKLKPLFWEYHEDKYTPNNELKRAIGRLFFFHGKGKKGGMKLDSLNVVDFNTANGKKISNLKTIWGQDFNDCFLETEVSAFDASDWFKRHGQNSGNYYKYFMALLIRHGILFENMMLDEKERDFARNVFLPAFIDIYSRFGMKPLIVALAPTDIEGDHFWMCYPGVDRTYIELKLSNTSES